MNGTALRKPTARRVVGMVAGIVIIALGIALFKQSHLGNDSISALNMRLAELLAIHAHFGDAPSLAVQLAWVIAAVLVTALGASLYQTADLGIAPYDYLSLGLRDYTPCPYFGCRIFTDALSALLCWLLGGLVGLGTLICAFCLGPFIQFFDRTFSQKVLQYKPNN